MSGRVYVRKFDWDEARRLRAEGMTYTRIAATLGVTFNAVYRVAKPGQLEKQAAQHRSWEQSGRCDDCGGQMNRLSRSHGSTRCRACAAIAKVKTDQDGNLYCPTCDSWLPPKDFYTASGRPARGRSSECRACSNARRRENRNANRERERAYWREHKRRRRSAHVQVGAEAPAALTNGERASDASPQ